MFATARFTGHDKRSQIFLYTLLNERFLCFDLDFTNDLPIFLERQTCRCYYQNKEIRKMIEMKKHIYDNSDGFGTNLQMMIEVMEE